jgi:hypothetical protein
MYRYVTVTARTHQSSTLHFITPPSGLRRLRVSAELLAWSGFRVTVFFLIAVLSTVRPPRRMIMRQWVIMIRGQSARASWTQVALEELEYLVACTVVQTDCKGNIVYSLYHLQCCRSDRVGPLLLVVQWCPAHTPCSPPTPGPQAE